MTPFTSGDGNRTNWPGVEERIRPILDAMQQEAGFNPVGHLRKSWIWGAREYAENVGTDPEIVKAAIREMQKNGLSIASPRSLVTIALKLKGHWKRDADSPASRQRYAESLEKWGVDNE